MISLEEFVEQKRALLYGLDDATQIAEEWCHQCPDLDDLDESEWLDVAHNSIRPQVEWQLGAHTPFSLEDATRAVMTYAPSLYDPEVLTAASHIDQVRERDRQERDARKARIEKIWQEMRAGTRPRVKIWGE